MSGMKTTYPSTTEQTFERAYWLLKKDPRHDEKLDSIFKLDDLEFFVGVRCPLCRWQPGASDMWFCEGTGTPEKFTDGCGTRWNTFATRGRCPGCAHQWSWTVCLRCGGWSLHEEWYEEREQD
jgi:hypothetical protein